jgi:predicted RNA-binding Zn ribbon-like protein
LVTEGDEAVLLALLNSSPMIDGVPADAFGSESAARAWLGDHGLDVPVADREALRSGRDLLQAVTRGERPPAALAGLLDGVVSRPAFAGDELTWTLGLSGGEPFTGGRAMLARAVLTWDELRTTRPGRLRACANDECRLFLLDRSKSNSGRWCSMASCGNRLKARRHHQRARQTGVG